MRYLATRAFLLAAAGAILAAQAAEAKAPSPYARKPTWLDTMIATCEAMAKDATPAARRRPLPDFGRSSFTVTAWVRTRQGGTILAKAPQTGQWVPQGKALFVRRGSVCFDIGWVGCVTSQEKVADGRWHHLALVSQPGQQSIFIDGRLSATGSLLGEADPKGWVVKIGQTADNFGGDFRGELDEVRVYNRPLAAAEVQADFAKPAPADDPGLVGYWPFEGDGEDASGSLNSAAKMLRCDFAAGRAGKALKLSGGGCALIAVGDAAGPLAHVWAQLQRDFPDEASRKEMAWEREDGIWDGRWRAGDWAALAQRYARASHRLATVAKALKAAAPSVKDRAALAAVRQGYLRSRRHGEALEALAAHNLPGLRAAIGSLARSRRDGRAAGEKHLARLDALEKRGIELAGSPGALAKWQADVGKLRREVLLTDNPLIDFDRLLFVRRFTYQSNHYYTDFINGCRQFGGNLCVLSLRDGSVTELLPSMKGGIFGRFDLSFDGRRVVFDWKAGQEKGFRIYEVGADGRGLRQLTFDPPDESERIRKYRNDIATWQGYPLRYYHSTDDMHPCYLPDGGICFISTRCEIGTLCDGPDVFTTTVLYRMDGDGGNMEKLTNSSVSEASPSIMNDGQILYTRWEYVDKGAVSVKCLWSMRPDGSGSAEVYGNDIALPPTFLHGRAIPGHGDLFVMLGTPHCPQSGVGTVIRVDTTKDIRAREPMTYITPEVDIRAEGGFHHRTGGGWAHGQNGPLYADPYPLSGDFFLVSHNPDKPWRDPKAWGLYLIDAFGNRERIYQDPEISCWQPYPLRPRIKPPVPTSARNADLAAKDLAVAIVTDVYHGMAGVERGSIRYIRVLEQVPRPWAARRRWSGDEYDQQHAVVTKDTHLAVKAQYGVVPVEADGSAHFVVPADRNIFFQALDEDYMAVQTERTYVNYRPGEMRTCIGCHETPQHGTPPVSSGSVLALKRPPSVPGPQPGEKTGSRPLHYPADVQPVLDRHCVKCHGGEKPKAGLDLTGTMTTLFSVSYENLLPERRGGRGRRSFDLIGPTIGENHPKTGNVHYLPPKSLGSHASVLVAMLSGGKVKLQDAPQAERAERLAKVHERVQLPREDMIRLTNWVDTNGQYYGSYYGRRNLRYKDHPNFRPVPTWQSAIGIPPLPEAQR